MYWQHGSNSLRVLGLLLVLSRQEAIAISDGQPFALFLDGTTRTVALQSLSITQQLTLQDGSQRQTIPLDQLIRWHIPHRSETAPGLLLTDGSFLALQRISDVEEWKDDYLTVFSLLWGTIQVRWDQVRALSMARSTDQGHERGWHRRLQMSEGDADQLWLDNGDRLEGELLSLSERHLEFRIGGRIVRIPLHRLSALVPNPAQRSPGLVGDARLLVGFRDGSHLLTKNCTFNGEQLELTCANGLRLHRDATALLAGRASIVRLQPLRGRVSYVSDHQPLDYVHFPYLSVRQPWGRDCNVRGNCLRVEGADYAKGLGMHSTSRLAYQLDGTYTRFDAQLALDDSAGQGGSVVFRVFLQACGSLAMRFCQPDRSRGRGPTPLFRSVARRQTDGAGRRFCRPGRRIRPRRLAGSPLGPPRIIRRPVR